uniref:ferroxidase n=1 Tax=Lepisosteus oculatus TaxID=7918 RepID=W5M0R5_LEPOC
MRTDRNWFWSGALLLVLVSQCSLAVERRYYIAAVLTEWDYYGDQSTFFSFCSFRGGQTYKKVVFREYDAEFKQAKPHPSWSGLLGPTLRGEVGDVIVVTFRNMADRTYSLHPHGIEYGKQSEGSLYFDNTSLFEKKDDVVNPGGEHKYIWEVTKEIAPTMDDPPCLTYTYFSHVNLVKDFNSGLIGALLICKEGSLSDTGKQISFDQEHVLLFGVFDESKSWYRTEEAEPAGPIKYSINGYINGSLPDLKICAYDHVSWHLVGMSSEPELFSIHFNGQVLQQKGHKLSTIDLVASSCTSANMTAMHAGVWLLSSKIFKHLEAGMHGYLEVQSCESKAPITRRLTVQQKRQSSEWVYYIAAEEIIWDYAPNLPGYVDREYKSKYLEPRADRIGRKYKKAVYVQYKDANFTKMEEGARKNETGILGPAVRAQIWDVIKIVFKNNASRPYSIYPHGLTISKSEEGASYPKDGSDNGQHEVKPGETHTYTWKVTEEDVPAQNDPRCLTRMYHSAVDVAKDIASGLIGPLLICKSQSLNKRNMQLKADKEQHAVLAVLDENKSWYIEENIRNYCTDPSKVNKEDPKFYESNIMRFSISTAINGFVYDSGQVLGFCHGEIVTWHVSSVGAQDYIETLHSYGHTFDLYDRKEDVLSLFPMSGETIAMDMDKIGHWLLASLNAHYSNKGMRLKFKDLECINDSSDEWETDSEPSDILLWEPEEWVVDTKTEILEPKEYTNTDDPETDYWISQLQIRSLRNKSQGLVAEEDLLDLSSVLREGDETNISPGDYNQTLTRNNMTESQRASVEDSFDISSGPGDYNQTSAGGNITESQRPSVEDSFDISSGTGDYIQTSTRTNMTESQRASVEDSFDISSGRGDYNQTLAGGNKKESKRASTEEDLFDISSRPQDYNQTLSRENLNQTSLAQKDILELSSGLKDYNQTLSGKKQTILAAATLQNNTNPEQADNEDLEFTELPLLEGPIEESRNNSKAILVNTTMTEEFDLKNKEVEMSTVKPETLWSGLQEINLPDPISLSEWEEVQKESVQSSKMDNVSSGDSDIATSNKDMFVYSVSLSNKWTSDRSSESKSKSDADFVLLDSGTVEILLDNTKNPANIQDTDIQYSILSPKAAGNGEDQNNITDFSSSTIDQNGKNANMNLFNDTVATLPNQTLETNTHSEEGNLWVLPPSSLPQDPKDVFNGTDVHRMEDQSSDTQPASTGNETSPGVSSPALETGPNVTTVNLGFEHWNAPDPVSSESEEDIPSAEFDEHLNTTPSPGTVNESSSDTHITFSLIREHTEDSLSTWTSPTPPSNSTETLNPHDLDYDGHSEEDKSSSRGNAGNVLICLKNTSTQGILTTSLDPSKRHWGYEGKHQSVPVKVPSHITKYMHNESTAGQDHKTKIKPQSQRRRKKDGVKVKRRRKTKPESRSSVISPRGHKPQTAGPRSFGPVKSEDDLNERAIVIGVPRRDFDDYELYLPLEKEYDVDQMDETAQNLGNAYEYVEYKDPYASAADVEDIDKTVKYYLQNKEGNVRIYYIAAEEVEWDYAGYKGQRRDEEVTDSRRNTQYKKAIFRSYLDSTFSIPSIRGEVDEHLGILGPIIKAEIDESIIVVFKNSASRPYSLHAHGVSFGKQMEGMKYDDESPHWYQKDDAVAPGSTYTYIWQATDKIGPKSADSACRTWAYYSGVNPEKDIHSGLIGPLLICQKGVLSNTTANTREFVLLFMTFDENESWYFEENMRKRQRMKDVDINDPELKEKNKFHAINGIIYSLKGLRMYTNQLVRWHLINMGSPKDIHSVHFHGQTFLNRQNRDYRMGVYPLLPGDFATVEMRPSKPGLWLLESEVGEFQQKGMQTLFLLLDEDCGNPLGLQQQSVKDNQITASQYRVSKGDWKPHLARLHNTGKYNAWSVDENTANSLWIQVDFQRPVVISKIATQGAKQLFSSYYVQKYLISYSTDKRKWIYYKGRSDSFRMTFEGNQNSYNVKENVFYPPMIARLVRLHPVESYGTPTVRMEFYGCELDGCSIPLGMESGDIPNDMITASSVYSNWLKGMWQPSFARLNNQGNVNAWRAKSNNVFQWLQVELKETKKITGIITQGAKSLGKEMYVQTYSLQYSDNGSSWKMYSDDTQVAEKIFIGNTDNNGHVKNYIYPPIFARFIRIVPKTWNNSITLRMELLGCDFE